MAQRHAAPGGSSPAVTAIERTTELSRRAWLGRQSVEYHAIREVDRPAAFDRTRLSIKIDVDSYDFQSSAKVERWDGATWQPVATIPYPLMACTRASTPNYLNLWDREENEPSFDGWVAIQTDEAELVRLASLVMGF